MPQVAEQESLSPEEVVEDTLMIKSLQAKKFRAFSSLELNDLRRINVIVGRNASGKTALLETIKLGLDGIPPVLPFLNQLRNLQTYFIANPTPEQFRGQFIDYFHGFDAEARIEIKIRDSENRSASLDLYFDPAKAVTTVRQAAQVRVSGFTPPPAESLPPVTIIPLAFDRVDFQGQRSSLLATVNAQGNFFLQPGLPLGIVSGFIGSSYYGGPGETATWLSQLSVQKRKPEVLDAVRRHFDFVTDITSESVLQGMPATVYADLSYLPKKIPLSLVSQGISRLVTIVLAIVQFKNGVVLIDEIENGLFYDQYERLWKTILDLAVHYNTQVFVSTHSNECLKGIVPAMESDPQTFCLLRARREESGSSIETFGGEKAEAALEKNGEVRD